MDTETLREERERLLKRIKVIEKQLGIKSKLTLDEIRDKVKEDLGIDVKDIGVRGSKKSKLAKQMFWRAGFLQMYSGTVLSEYCGMKSRFSAIVGRNLYVSKCKYDKSLAFDWNVFKSKL